MSNAQSQKMKKRRSLKRTNARPTREPDPRQILPIAIDQNELDGIMKRIALGQEANPQAAFSKIYALALDSIAETLKSALNAFVNDLSNAKDLPPFVEKLIPQSKDPDTLKKLTSALTSSIDRSRDKIQESLRNETRKASYDNYADYTDMLRKTHLLQPVREEDEAAFADAIPQFGHITADRLREICNDVRSYKPTKTTHDVFKIDLNRLQRTREMNFNLHTKTDDSAQDTHDACSNTTQNTQINTDAPTLSEEEKRQESEAVRTIIQDAVAQYTSTVDKEKENAISAAQTAQALQETLKDASQNIASGVSNQAPLTDEIQAVNQFAEQIPALFEQALLNAVRPQTDTDAPTATDETLEQLRTFGVEFAETFDGITAMMTEFANQLSAAIIEDQAHKLPTLSEALLDDPRMQNDDDLKEFVSFLESNNAAEETDDDLSNDILSEAFGALLDQLDD